MKMFDAGKTVRMIGLPHGETRRMAIAHPCVSWVGLYAPRTIAVNVTQIKRGFNACQTHRNMYPSIFNRFPVIQPVSSKVRNFSTFLAHSPVWHIFVLLIYSPAAINSCCIVNK